MSSLSRRHLPDRAFSQEIFDRPSSIGTTCTTDRDVPFRTPYDTSCRPRALSFRFALVWAKWGNPSWARRADGSAVADGRSMISVRKLPRSARRRPWPWRCLWDRSSPERTRYVAAADHRPAAECGPWRRWQHWHHRR